MSAGAPGGRGRADGEGARGRGGFSPIMMEHHKNSPTPPSHSPPTHIELQSLVRSMDSTHKNGSIQDVMTSILSNENTSNYQRSIKHIRNVVV